MERRRFACAQANSGCNCGWDDFPNEMRHDSPQPPKWDKGRHVRARSYSQCVRLRVGLAMEACPELLLYNSLDQISGPIDIDAATDRQRVGEQLKWHDL
jgi:hypothetical protein